MGNKISDIIGAIETGLKELVTSGDLAAVVRRVVKPYGEANVPIAGIVVEGSPREIEAGSWEAWPVEVLIGLLIRRGEDNADQAILNLTALVLGKIRAVNDSDAPGGVIDRPRFSTWYHAEQNKPLAPVGAVIEIRVTVSGTLATDD